MKPALMMIGTLAAGIAGTAGVAAAQWSDSQLLSGSTQTDDEIKGTRIYPAGDGGFHASWQNVNNGGGTFMQYRRVRADLARGPIIDVDAAGFNFGPELAETGDGSVHVIWENWGPGDEGPVVGWSRLPDGGSFSTPVEISSTSNGRGAKIPLIEHLGPAGSGRALMTYFLANRGDLRFQTYDPAANAWSSDLWLGSQQNPANPPGEEYWADSEYEVHGIARNPITGDVYRLFDDVRFPGGTSDNGHFVSFARFDAASNTWGPAEHVAEQDFFARAAIAVTGSGDVLVAWDADETTHFRLRTEGGWGPVQTDVFGGPFFGDIVAIPGTDDFYAINAGPRDRVGIFGRHYDAETGQWGPLENINPGQLDDFTPDMDLAVTPDGVVYTSWEYWGTGGPQAWYSAREAFPVPEPAGAMILFVAGALSLRRRRRPV